MIDITSLFTHRLALRAKQEGGQRTVLRLTLVKDANMHAIDDYARIVELAEPSFVEALPSRT